jgi:hypothetical protein
LVSEFEKQYSARLHRIGNRLAHPRERSRYEAGFNGISTGLNLLELAFRICRAGMH